MTPNPPRAELFESEGAEAVFRGFEALPPELKLRVLDEIESGLAADDRPATTLKRRVSRAIRCLNEAHKFFGHSPSVREYERGRREHPEHEWASAISVKRALGVATWDAALRRAALPASVVPGDALAIELGPAFSSEEVVAALRECADELTRVPTFNDYTAWVHRPDVRRRDGRRPLSQNSFMRLFGSYQGALLAAGIVRSNDEAVITAGGRLRSARYRVTNHEMLDAIREVAARLGRSPRVYEYIRHRELIYLESRETVNPRAIPAYGTIARRFPRWDEALVAAGLEPTSTREIHVTGRVWSGPRYTDEQLVAAFRAAQESVGEPFTQRAYNGWRHRQIVAGERLAGELPSAESIARRFGGWSQSRAAAAEDPTDHR